MKKIISLIAMGFIVNSLSAQSSLHEQLTQIKKPNIDVLQNEHLAQLSENEYVSKYIQSFVQKNFVQKPSLKSAKPEELLLDSIITDYWDYSISGWARDLKEEFNYDINGNRINMIAFNWGKNINNWIAEYKTEHTYDSKGNETNQITHVWNINTGNWRCFDVKQPCENILDEKGLIKQRQCSSCKDNRFSPTFKQAFTYDENGNLTELLDYGWDNSSNIWDLLGKNTYLYNGEGNKIQDSRYSWNKITNNWVDYAKEDLIYDENGHLKQKTLFLWDSITNSWIKNYKTEYLYNDVNKQVLSVSANWDTSLNNWIVYDKSEKIYDKNGRVILDAKYTWNYSLDTLILSHKNEYDFDDNGNETLCASYGWNEYKNKLVGFIIIKRKYNENGIEAFFGNNKWNYETNDWNVNTWNKHEFNYDASKKVKECIVKEWNNNDSIWINKSKQEWKYDNNGNRLQEIIYSWEENSWIIDSKTETNYNLDGKITYETTYKFNSNLNSLVLAYEYHSTYIEGLLIEEFYIINESNGHKKTYYYSNILTNVPGNEIQSDISIFPNPATNYITFNIKNNSTPPCVEMYNAQGKKVLAKTITNNKLSVGHLRKGIYFWKVTQNNKIYSGKILIQ